MVLAGLSTLVPAMAQNAADPPRLRARVANPAIKNGRPTDIFILSANGPMVQFVETRESQDILQQAASAFRTLYIFETDDFVDAKVAMENRKYQDARNKFHALIGKYAATLPIKDSLSARAAVNELECAMRMMDWAGVKGLVSRFPVRTVNLSPSAQNDLEVAKIMALIPDRNWNEVKTQASSFLATKKNATRLQQARMKYALGAASLHQGTPTRLWIILRKRWCSCMVPTRTSVPPASPAPWMPTCACRMLPSSWKTPRYPPRWRPESIIRKP